MNTWGDGCAAMASATPTSHKAKLNECGGLYKSSERSNNSSTRALDSKAIRRGLNLLADQLHHVVEYRRGRCVTLLHEALRHEALLSAPWQAIAGEWQSVNDKPFCFLDKICPICLRKKFIEYKLWVRIEYNQWRIVTEKHPYHLATMMN